uniref:Growth arrest and DNA-damage-inducible, beta a n=2 Tax=Oncorhynchus TaxID=8016 RepID=A0A8C7FYN4_ONCKI
MSQWCIAASMTPIARLLSAYVSIFDIQNRSFMYYSLSFCSDPDSVVLCVLATDEDVIPLQIHFTLIQAFCCDNDINILRVSGMRRLAQVLGEPSTADSNGNEPNDLHCILVTNTQCQSLKCQALQDVGNYCEESRCKNQWVPYLSLQER